jgi:hypothetical protein
MAQMFTVSMEKILTATEPETVFGRLSILSENSRCRSLKGSTS